ncbi:16S rRNA (cytosine(967)-C(5))-methyltransferase RsmB [Microcoleus sp. bin38.metabat.b11b12b14.051]|uniref:16S rRNA (cytosine(967)-C(5))-methyltransferase RsmB n=1 Tax=Microcoleus sp. bin38.metabat.b11b12b14.051 TaxID=2742709 RepID=UPI0025D56927|nr:16S rRNA (cytosine(967)-C(5))-methyltransferase RsmB [Microcoleus sp. bin38.metabat.b11b12b14.051]
MQNPRQIAFLALREVHRRGAFADAALDRTFRNSQLSDLDRRLVTELVYGSVRRMRSIDFIIDKLATKKSSQQPPDLRTILHLGLYQLQYLNHIPPSAAVNTTVQLAKENKLSGLSSFVNGLLRQYIRLTPPTPPYQGGAKSEPNSAALPETFTPPTPPYQGGAKSEPNSPQQPETQTTSNPPPYQGGAKSVPNSPQQPETQTTSNPPPYQGGARGGLNSLNPPPYQGGARGGLNFLTLPENRIERLGILHSFPDWLVELWNEQIGETETEQLCEWFNQSPTIHLRINPLKSSIAQIEAAFQAQNISTSRIPHLPQALRLNSSTGAIPNLPGYREGWWTIQDSSAQLVTHLLDPQPGEIIIDACAAPGGKTTHSAELMQDTGTIYACDKTASRLKKITENADRLQMKSIKIHTGDSRQFPEFINLADRVLLDAPCSGLGTLHRRADARWRHTPENIQEQSQLQSELLANVATFVKSGGVLVYATCTIHPLENERVVRSFLDTNPNWKIEPPTIDLPVQPSAEGWVKVWPHKHQMDGFFMVRLKRD